MNYRYNKMWYISQCQAGYLTDPEAHDRFITRHGQNRWNQSPLCDLGTITTTFMESTFNPNTYSSLNNYSPPCSVIIKQHIKRLILHNRLDNLAHPVGHVRQPGMAENVAHRQAQAMPFPGH